MGWDNCTIYIENLSSYVTEHELDDVFCKYGEIRDVVLKRSRGCAYVEFARRQDALEAARGRNGYCLDGKPMKVTVASASSGPYVSRHTKYRVLIKNLPDTATWQELKNHASMAGKVSYADIYSQETGKIGVVDYQTEEVMQYALMKLEGTEFKNSTSQSNITVEEYDGRYIDQQHSSEQVVAGDNKLRPEVSGDSGTQHNIQELDGDSGPQHRIKQVVEGHKTVMPEFERESQKQHSDQEAVVVDKRRRSDDEASLSSRLLEIPTKRPRV